MKGGPQDQMKKGHHLIAFKVCLSLIGIETGKPNGDWLFSTGLL